MLPAVMQAKGSESHASIEDHHVEVCVEAGGSFFPTKT